MGVDEAVPSRSSSPKRQGTAAVQKLAPRGGAWERGRGLEPEGRAARREPAAGSPAGRRVREHPRQCGCSLPLWIGVEASIGMRVYAPTECPPESKAAGDCRSPKAGARRVGLGTRERLWQER